MAEGRPFSKARIVVSIDEIRTFGRRLVASLAAVVAFALRSP